MGDPFRARSKPTAEQAVPSEQPKSPPPVVPTEGITRPSRGQLEDMRKPELQALARERGLSDEGTRLDLVDRLSGTR